MNLRSDAGGRRPEGLLTSRLVALIACTSAFGVVVLLACGSEDPAPQDRTNIPVPTDGSANVDGAAPPRREAGVPTKCATFAGSTSTDTCSCGETEAPYTGPATDTCPTNATPHYCISYDVVSPPPLRRECTCHPKCVFQRLGSSSSGDAGAVDTCRCGVTSHLVLGGDGAKDESRPTCEGYAVCCRGSSGCDCTSDGAYACPSDTVKVPSCAPTDFNVKIWKAVVYGSPSYTDLVDVERCR